MLPGSEYWTLVTYMLLHGDWMHLTFNALWLLVFGTPVARYLGPPASCCSALPPGWLADCPAWPCTGASRSS